MKIELKKFGEILTSRPAGREAYLVARAYLLPKNDKENIEIDFSGVKVLSPSWADEFLTHIKKKYGDRIFLKNVSNPSVSLTIKLLQEVNNYKFQILEK